MKSAIAAVILAAGSSTRMGAVNKLLADWRGKPLLYRVAETVLGAGIQTVHVVTGHDANAVRLVLTGLDVGFVHNPNFGRGLSTSIICGITSIDENVEGVAILLGDMPDLQVETLNRLMVEFDHEMGRCIIAPNCDGRRGNPVIWPRRFFPELIALSGDKGGRDLMKKHFDQVKEIPCDDMGVLMDIDSPDDLENA